MPSLCGVALVRAVFLAVFTTPLFGEGTSSLPEVQAVRAAQGTNINHWILDQCDRLIAAGEDADAARYVAVMTCRFLRARYRPTLLEYLAPLVERLNAGPLDVVRPWAQGTTIGTSPVHFELARAAVDLYRLFADALEGEGYYADAEQPLRRALEFGNAAGGTLCALADNLRKQNRLSEALALLESERQATTSRVGVDQAGSTEQAVSPIDWWCNDFRQKLESGYIFRPHKKNRDRGRFHPARSSSIEES